MSSPLQGDDSADNESLSMHPGAVVARVRAREEHYFKNKVMRKPGQKRDIQRDWIEFFGEGEQGFKDALAHLDQVHEYPSLEAGAPPRPTRRRSTKNPWDVDASPTLQAKWKAETEQYDAALKEAKEKKATVARAIEEEERFRPSVPLTVLRSAVLAFCSEKGREFTGERTPEIFMATLERAFSEDELRDITSFNPKDFVLRTNKYFKLASSGVRTFKAASARELLRHLQSFARENARQAMIPTE